MAQMATIKPQVKKVLAGISNGTICIRLPSGCFRRMDCHDEIATDHRDYSPVTVLIWHLTGSVHAKRSSAGITLRCARKPAALAGVLLMLNRARGWSQQYAALAYRFSVMSRRFIAANGFANGFTLWRDLGMTAKENICLSCIDRDPLDASRLRCCRDFTGCPSGTGRTQD